MLRGGQIYTYINKYFVAGDDPAWQRNGPVRARLPAGDDTALTARRLHLAALRRRSFQDGYGQFSALTEAAGTQEPRYDRTLRQGSNWRARQTTPID